MGIFLLIMGLVIVVAIFNTLQKKSRHTDNSSRSNSNSESINSTDLMTRGAIFSFPDTAQPDCSDSTSSGSDSSGGSSCD